MESHPSKIFISESIGSVSSLVIAPKNMKAIVVLAHGAGAGMTHPFMESLASALAKLLIGTVRYNFPFIEKASKRPDVPAVAEKTVNMVLEHCQNSFPGVPIFLGGKSFGGRMSSHYVANKNPKGVSGIVFYGFPLHAPGKPGVDRANHLKAIDIPMLFLQGSRDALAVYELIEEVCSGLRTAKLDKLEGADHSFKVKNRQVIEELANRTQIWAQSIIGKR
jgi:predicted alpha/beta-hydrolase family hydrolase